MTDFLPVLLRRGEPPWFPDPRRADEEGLVAVGGDLSVERLLAGYRAGIFPWFDAANPPLWWSPDPRGVLVPEKLHVARRLERHLRTAGLRVTRDRAFSRVMHACGQERPEGSWIFPAMESAYAALHHAGHAQSFEVWRGEELVGGLYGVRVGGLFAAESMFHRERDASKVALVTAVRTLAGEGVELIDVQFVTRHLARFGAESWPRTRYLEALPALVGRR